MPLLALKVSARPKCGKEEEEDEDEQWASPISSGHSQGWACSPPPGLC